MRCHREIKLFFEKFSGVELLSIDRKRHWKVKVRVISTGQEATFIMPTSSSDVRSLKNKVSQVRNTLGLREVASVEA